MARAQKIDDIYRIDSVMMNGKTLGECTGSEFREFAKFCQGKKTVGEMIESGHMTTEWAVTIFLPELLRAEVKAEMKTEAAAKRSRKKRTRSTAALAKQ